MRVAFCYQIRRCTDDVRPKGKAGGGADGTQLQGCGERRLTAAPIRPPQNATTARARSTAARSARPAKASRASAGPQRSRTSRCESVGALGPSYATRRRPVQLEPGGASGLPYDFAPAPA